MTKRVILTRPSREAYVREKKSGDKEAPLPPSIEGVGRGVPFVEDPGQQNKVANGLDFILGYVELLTEPELRKLYDHLALVLQARGPSAGEERDTDMWATAVYDALVAANGGSGAGQPGPLVVKRLLATRSSWPYVRDFAALLHVEDMTVAMRLSVFRLLAGLLVERCQGIARHTRIPLTAKLVANNTGDLAAVFNDAFPGYVESGLLPFLVKRLVSGGANAA